MICPTSCTLIFLNPTYIIIFLAIKTQEHYSLSQETFLKYEILEFATALNFLI